MINRYTLVYQRLIQIQSVFSELKRVSLLVLEISVFSMVSKEFTSCVVDYISTLVWKKKMIFASFHPSTCLEERSINVHFRDLGKWVCTETTADELQLMH